MQPKRMHAGKSCLSSISGRTRSRWDAFYRSCYDEIKKKPDQEGNSIEFETKNEISVEKGVGENVGPISVDDSEDSDDSETSGDDDDDRLKICKYVRKKGSGDAGRPAKKKKDLRSGDIDFEDSDDSETRGDNDDELNICKNVRKKGSRQVGRLAKNKIKKNKGLKTGEIDLIDMLVESLWKERDLVKKNPVENDLRETALPLKFRFENDGESSLAEKTDWEKEIDSLFSDLDMGLWESEMGCTNSSLNDDRCTVSTDINESPAAHCGRGEHDPVLDEQIGIVCKYCFALLLDIKYVVPDFYVPQRCERKDFQESKDSRMDQIQFQGSTYDGNLECSNKSEGTVLDLIPSTEKELYPHQLEGFEFLWRNIAGDISIKNMEKLPANGGRGCIISHAPGTGKTRLTIVFLQTFMKLYPTCRPVIIAPRGMLLTWEQEFKKWKANLKFHNLNETKLSSQETAIAANIMDQTHIQERNKDYIRFVQLCSWMKGGSILGIGYRLFEELAGENAMKRSNNDKFKKILLELPGLLVLDEGHTPRNNQSLTWKALTKVKTQRRVILSGTPFQNNFSELYNTLCIVNPTIFHQIESKNSGRKRKVNEYWANLTSSISKNSTGNGVKKLRAMIEPFVHIHKGSILQKTLPGLRDCLVVLKQTNLQNILLQNISQVDKYLEQAYLASLISVHPSLVAEKPDFSYHRRTLKSLESDPDAGVKTLFLIKLIQLSIRLHEKVLIFSEFIDPLLHIKNLIKRHFCWNEGREVIYMDGDLGIKQRQHLISSFNDKCSEAKVLLASQRACSEGINLVGASRVVLLDVAWNPSVERQAICRAYRLGQEKIVYVYHLVTLMEVKKYARQAEKERISELIFCSKGGQEMPPGDEAVWEDKVLEAMVRNESVGCIFERIVHQPKAADLVNTFGFVDLK